MLRLKSSIVSTRWIRIQWKCRWVQIILSCNNPPHSPHSLMIFWFEIQTAYLEVVIPPDILYEETSGDMMVPEGSSAKLICKARGFPKPKITWRREDGREIIARNGPHGKTKGKNTQITITTNYHIQHACNFYLPNRKSVIRKRSSCSWRRNVVVDQNYTIWNGHLFVHSIKSSTTIR